MRLYTSVNTQLSVFSLISNHTLSFSYMKPDISNVLSPVKVFVYDCELCYSPKNKMTNF